jgi:hypothetical protein
MRTSTFLFLLLAACQERGVPPAPPSAPKAPLAQAPGPPAMPAAVAGAWTEAQEGCVDRWLAAQKLDAYGSPLGTMYMGGTPLFDEATGRRTSRQAFLAAHQPEALHGCGVGP